MSRFRYALVFAMGSALLLSGCDTARTIAPRALAPVADSPQNAVRLLQYALNYRDMDAIESLLPEDATFVSAGADSAGSVVRVPWTRAELVHALRNLLVGSPTVPPATSIALNIDANLVPFPDTRPGMSPELHRTIRTSVDLKVETADGSGYEVTGMALFYATRGDSAQISAEQKAHGAKPDSTRWWLSRWEDETLPLSGGLRALPSHAMTLGAVLRLYLGREPL